MGKLAVGKQYNPLVDFEYSLLSDRLLVRKWRGIYMDRSLNNLGNRVITPFTIVEPKGVQKTAVDPGFLFA